MSFEYLIKFNSAEDCGLIKAQIENSPLAYSSPQEYIAWQEKNLTAPLLDDVRFYIEDKIIFMVINRLSAGIFNQLAFILACCDYELIDSDTEENISLEYLFRAVLKKE